MYLTEGSDEHADPATEDGAADGSLMTSQTSSGDMKNARPENDIKQPAAKGPFETQVRGLW